MATVFDVAQYILERRGALSGKKLQKLVYYSQAWSLAWTGSALFSDRIEAWRDGPVAPALYAHHRYAGEVASIPSGRSSALSGEQTDTVDSVLAHYGDYTAEALIERSHTEDPWISARRGLFPWQAGKQEITHAAMLGYYGAE